MENTLEDMDNRLAIMDNRIIESAQENKANINLNNLTDDATNVLVSRLNMDNILNGENYFKSPYKIKCGTTVAHSVDSGSGIQGGWGSVTFDEPFSSIPIVITTCERKQDDAQVNSFHYSYASIFNVTADGFEFKTGDGLNCKVNWVAFGV